MLSFGKYIPHCKTLPSHWSLTSGQEQACSRVTRLFVCHHAENGLKDRKMALCLVSSSFTCLTKADELADQQSDEDGGDQSGDDSADDDNSGGKDDDDDDEQEKEVEFD